MGVLVPRLPERHSPLLVDSYTHELKQQHKMPNKGSKKAKKSGSNIFSLFSQKQIQEFKEAFGIIDNDKDGIITAPDLKKAFEGIGRPTTWLERPPDQSTSPRWSHSSLRRCLEVPMMTWGEKFSSNEIYDAFREFKIDGGMIDAEHLKSIMVARKKSLSQRISSRQEKRLRPKWVSFLIAKKTLLVIKYPFESRHQHLSTTNCWGRAKKAPKKSCVSKMYQNQSR